ncbi:hypothetical protein B0H12DRAFT_1228042 [Mycena haematopus]|nr:hypothetical protein B0H12DRAFT_1228042 [Mycena haematopus]
MAPQGSKRSVRANHRAATSGMGVHFTSPLKARDKRKKVLALGLGHAARLAEARGRLEARLERRPIPTATSDASPHVPQPSINSDTHPQPDNEGWINEYDPHFETPEPPHPASCQYSGAQTALYLMGLATTTPRGTLLQLLRVHARTRTLDDTSAN